MNNLVENLCSKSLSLVVDDRGHGRPWCCLDRPSRLNSVITVITYAPVVTLLGAVARACGSNVRGDVTFLTVLQNVLIYLGIPLVLGICMWLVGRKYPCYRTWFLPRFSPAGLLALLWTVLMMFAEMSKPLLGGDAMNHDMVPWSKAPRWFP